MPPRPLPDTDRADRARQSATGGWSRTSYGVDGNVLHRWEERPPAALPPSRPSLIPPPTATPLPHPLSTPLPHPASGAPVPVAIVSASASAFHEVATHPDHTPTGPLGPGLHRDFTRGNFTGGFDGPGFGSTDHFDPGPRRGPDLSMIHGQSVEPHVDDTQLIALEGKLSEAVQQMDALGSKAITPTVNSGNIDAYIAKLERAAALERSLGKIGGGTGGSGTSGSLGPSYPQTKPTGRQMGPR